MKNYERNIPSAIANGSLSFAIILGTPAAINHYYPNDERRDEIASVTQMFNEVPPTTIDLSHPATNINVQQIPEAGTLPNDYPQEYQEKDTPGKAKSKYHTNITVKSYPSVSLLPADGCKTYHPDKQPPTAQAVEAVSLDGQVKATVTRDKYVIFCANSQVRTPVRILVRGTKN